MIRPTKPPRIVSLALLLFLPLKLSSAWIVVSHPSRISTVDRRWALPVHAQGVACAGLDSVEREAVLSVVESVSRDNFGMELEQSTMAVFPNALDLSDVYPGATGRVLVVATIADFVEDFYAALSEEIDQLLLMPSSPDQEGDPVLKQPVLLSVQELSEASNYQSQEQLKQLVVDQIEAFDLVASFVPGEDQTVDESVAIPSKHVQIDGAMVHDPATKKDYWDTSSIVVFDDLVSDDLRRRLLNVVQGKDSDFYDETEQPDPARWISGGIVDKPDEEETDEHAGFGLSVEAIDDICDQHHDAIQEFESILSQVFPQFRVCRMPEAVLGSSISPLTANAPVFGDSFSYHIDADPYLTPPSPWTDIFGRYPNRAPGKPLFVSCLVYLNEKWDNKLWGAPTRFLDVQTDTTYDIQPMPGRVVFMDQDITHSVVAPLESAEGRPRYSMVWKLIFHPKNTGQEMNSCNEKHCPDSISIGSANQNQVQE